MSSDRSDTAAGGQVPATRRRGGRIVQSRYLQYDKKNTKKVLGLPNSGVAQRRAEKDASSSFSSSSFSSSSFSSSSTSLSSSGTKARSVLSQKHETSAGVGHSSLNQSSFEKGDLESTLLDEGKINQSDLDISTISDKTDLKKSFHSESASEEDSDTISVTGAIDEEADTGDPVAELESETLLLTYLRIMAEKNVAKMEEKAEKNLLMLCEEKQRQQEKLWELKREILLKEREQKLSETLDKQIEVLSPLVAVCEQFKEQYKSFADSLDATRHELPIKNIHIEGDKQAYLDELGKQLTITQELLAEIMPNHSEETAKPLSALKELKEVSQQLNKELQRSFTDVQNLAFDASKEVSLHNQYVCEENHGVDVVKSWYFN